MVVDPVTGAIVGATVKPAIEFVSHGLVGGFGWIQRYFSPTILIAGQHNAGKTTLSEYFRTGAFPPHALSMDETQEFKSRLVEVVFSQRSATFWIRDSRGFFDADPLAKDIRHVHPVFIYFVFDIKKIDETPDLQTMKYEFVEGWMEKFKMRVQEHVAVDSKAKRTLCGAAALVNKCDTVDEATFRRKQVAFDCRIRPLFRDLQPLLGFGDQRFEVFFTSMIDGKTLPRPTRPESDFPWAIDFMVRMLSNGGVIK